MTIHRRGLLGAALAMPFVATASAQTWPARSIRLVVPFAAGGAADSAARTVFPRVSEILGQTIVVENRTGAGGSIGAAAVAQAAADGYTWLFDASSHIVNPSLLRNLPFDYASFVPVSQVASFPQVIAVKDAFPARSLAELIEAAKARPGELSFGTQGNATAGHLALELFQSQAGIKLTHVPYRGGADAARDLAAGTVDGVLITALSAGPIVQSGRARMLAVTVTERLANWPAVPTLNESGFPGFDMSEWVGLVAPSGTPAPIVQRMYGAVAEVLKEQPVRERLAQLGAVPVGTDPEVFGRFLREGRGTMARLVREAGIQAN
ncbi:Bug family tripartite tricarboxylate transporter substrate binding protein [Elioraea rosea]|uniref:Bug family tripartite tricarboxylate transporter substrate binding protein n=1 Tax=Elioraea rosea TaxID=2492390 RepID=UPI00118693CA|nr:tripartite tricarboxylate transporter substrate-binding protein [Elioraea rosea]